MTERNAQRPSLSRLYRRFAGSHDAPLPAAEDLLDLSRVPHADDAAAPVVADLLRFARALEPVSAELGNDVRAAFDGETAPAHRRAAPRRIAAAAPRRWRPAAALAASVLALVGVWTLQHGRVAPVTAPATASRAPGNAVPDRIFAATESANAPAGDEIFRSQFSAPAATGDVIFRSTWNS